MASETERQALADEVRTALERACPGSRTRLLGSLAAGTADDYSDLDVEWVVPDREFAACLARAESALERVRPVAAVRRDPAFLHSDRRRLLFVRFTGVSLFWRLDLDVRAESVAHDADYDRDNPGARAREGEWSRPASALANAIGAVKAVARQRPDEARGLLDRGFARIGVPYEVGAGADARRGGEEATALEPDWAAEVGRLARAAARQEPELRPLAEQAVRLAEEHGRVDR